MSVREAPVIAIVGQQELSAPDCAVVAEAQSIESDAEHRGRIQCDTVLGEAAGDMRVVMLDLQRGVAHPRLPAAGKLGRQVFGMEVDAECRGGWLEDRPIERQILLVVGERRGVFQIALVLRQDRLPVLEQAERRLELAAQGHQLGRGFEACRQFDRARREAAGPANTREPPAMTRTTESSTRLAILRSCMHARHRRYRQSCSPALSRLGDWRLPATRCRWSSPTAVDLLQKQEMERRVGSMKPSESGRAPRRRAAVRGPPAPNRTIGASAPSSKPSSAGVTPQYRRMTSRSRAISAKGLP